MRTLYIAIASLLLTSCATHDVAKRYTVAHVDEVRPLLVQVKPGQPRAEVLETLGLTDNFRTGDYACASFSTESYVLRPGHLLQIRFDHLPPTFRDATLVESDFAEGIAKQSRNGVIRITEHAAEPIVDVKSCVSVFANSFDKISPEAGRLRLVRRPGAAPWIAPGGPVATNCLLKVGETVRSGDGGRFGLAPVQLNLVEVAPEEASMTLVFAGQAFPVSVRYKGAYGK